jgi:hypothetical protein
MFTKIMKSRLSYISLIASLALLAMCSKDDDGPGTNQRIKVSNYYYDGELGTSTEIKYNSEKITLMKCTYYSYQGSSDYWKIEVSYPMQDSIIESMYYWDTDIWRPLSKKVTEFQNGLLIRTTSAYPDNNGNWVDENKYEYLYNDTKLMEMVHYSGGNLNDKTIYEYDGSRLAQATVYSYDEDWILSGKDTLFYSGELIDSLLGYNYKDGVKLPDHKYEYLFEQGLLKNIDIYEDDSTSWSYIEHYFFTYNDHGNITGWWHERGGSTYNYEYIYENASGNYTQFNAPGSLYWNFYWPLDPV